MEIQISKPKIHTIENRQIQEYSIKGIINSQITGDLAISQDITIPRNTKKPGHMDYWYQQIENCFFPIPVVTYQHTHPDYRGQGRSQQLIINAND